MYAEIEVQRNFKNYPWFCSFSVNGTIYEEDPELEDEDLVDFIDCAKDAKTYIEMIDKIEEFLYRWAYSLHTI